MAFPSNSQLPLSPQFVRTALLLLGLLCGVHRVNGLQIDTPFPIRECDLEKLNWGGGQAPFTLNIRFESNSSILEGFTNLTGSTLLWQAKVPAGSQLYLEIIDSSNNKTGSLSGTFIIQPGNDTCLQYSTASFGTTAGKVDKPELLSRNLNLTDTFNWQS